MHKKSKVNQTKITGGCVVKWVYEKLFQNSFSKWIILIITKSVASSKFLSILSNKVFVSVKRKGQGHISS